MSAWDSLTIEMVSRIGDALEQRLKIAAERLFDECAGRQRFSEEHAAEYLDVPLASLQAWRRRNLIQCAQLPKGRLVTDDGLSGRYHYRREDLDAFFDMYLKNIPKGKRLYIASRNP